MSFATYATTLRALDAERSGARAATLLAAGALLIAWVGWSLGAEVAVCAESASATLVPVEPVRVLAAPVDGVLAMRNLEPGRRVRAGELLAEIDGREPRARLAALDDRRRALGGEVEAVAAQQAAMRRALDEERGAEADASGERRQRAGEAAAAAALAGEVRARDAELAAAGLLAPAAAARSRAEAEQRARAAAATALAAGAGTRRGRAALVDRGAAAERLGGELSHLRGELAAVAAERAAVIRDLTRRSLRAPMDGRLAAVTAAQPGALVAQGTAIATLVPDGPVEAVADFTPAAGAAVHAAQRAWVRLPAGPGFGAVTLPARVRSVAPAPAPGRGGGWEVHLDIPTDAVRRSPLARPGGSCRIAVEIARDTPAGVALRALGRGARAAVAGGGEAEP